MINAHTPLQSTFVEKFYTGNQIRKPLIFTSTAICTLGTFKTRLKTELFTLAYPTKDCSAPSVLPIHSSAGDSSTIQIALLTYLSVNFGSNLQPCLFK